jgi:hypothetical protein
VRPDGGRPELGWVAEDVLLALAEDLEVVDEVTWNEATGAD